MLRQTLNPALFPQRIEVTDKSKRDTEEADRVKGMFQSGEHPL